MKVLKQGMNDKQVGDMKALLVQLGYKNITPGNPEFGSATRSSVIQFQRDNGFPDTGEFAKREWETAIALTSPSQPEQRITSERLGRAIIAEAARFINLREIKPNARWDNPATQGVDTILCSELRAMMKSSPWEEGWAYCLAFAEGVGASALSKIGAKDIQVDKFRRTISPHVMTTVNSLRQRGLLESKFSEAGSIWLAQYGTGSSGHAGIIVSGSSLALSSIEANTSKDAVSGDKDREGDWITTKTFNPAGRGSLRTRGFLSPSGIIKLIS